MIFDLNTANGNEFPGADVCIVGAGAAGIVLALELERLGKRVLLIEAGGRDIEAASQDAYRSEVVGHRHNGVHSGRFRSYGGTTKKWGGQVLELDTIDFEKRDWVAGSGWPFQKSELEPYYRRSLEYQDVSGSVLNDAEVWQALKLPPPQVGNSLLSYFTRWCPEPDFTRLHGAALQNSANIGIYLHASACGFQFAADGATISGVRCRTLSGVEHIFTAKQFVLCLGTIETSRFLLQPEDNSRETRWNQSGLLGKHYQDHIDCNAAWIDPIDRTRLHAWFDNVYLGRYKYHPKLKLTPELQRDKQVLNIGSTLFFISSLDEELAATRALAKHILRGRLDQVSISQLAHAALQAPMLVRQIARYKLQHRAWNPPTARIALRVHCEQEPQSASSITLSSDRDKFGLFRTRIDWRISALEKHTIREYIHIAAAALQSAGIASLQPDAALYDDNPDSGIESIMDDSNHQMGGARMSSNAADGVVTPDLRLHAAPNAYLCSGAVFPTSGFSNPTHTVLALAVRLAHHLAGAARA